MTLRDDLSQTIAAQRPELDLRIYAWKQTHGDITVYLTWLISSGDPCIVMVPMRPPLHFQAVTPCVVPLESAHLWAEGWGGESHVKTMAEKFAKTMNFDPSDPHRIFKITDLVRHYLEDMLKMPDIPTSQTHGVVGEMMRHDEDGDVHHTEIIDYVH